MLFRPYPISLTFTQDGSYLIFLFSLGIVCFSDLLSLRKNRATPEPNQGWENCTADTKSTAHVLFSRTPVASLSLFSLGSRGRAVNASLTLLPGRQLLSADVD